MMTILSLGGAVSLVAFMQTDPTVPLLFAGLFTALFLTFGCLNLTVGPLSAESVPASLMSTATGVAICVGELFGGGVAPIIAGAVAEAAGFHAILHLALGAMCVGFLVSFLLNETAPARLDAAQNQLKSAKRKNRRLARLKKWLFHKNFAPRSCIADLPTTELCLGCV